MTVNIWEALLLFPWSWHGWTILPQIFLDHPIQSACPALYLMSSYFNSVSPSYSFLIIVWYLSCFYALFLLVKSVLGNSRMENTCFVSYSGVHFCYFCCLFKLLCNFSKHYFSYNPNEQISTKNRWDIEALLVILIIV